MAVPAESTLWLVVFGFDLLGWSPRGLFVVVVATVVVIWGLELCVLGLQVEGLWGCSKACFEGGILRNTAHQRPRIWMLILRTPFQGVCFRIPFFLKLLYEADVFAFLLHLGLPWVVVALGRSPTIACPDEGPKQQWKAVR